MEYFAVIDTETNWDNQVMSIGVTVASDLTFQSLDARYYVLTPEWEIGGMYDGVLDLAPVERTGYCRRKTALQDLIQWLKNLGVSRIFAYNARFDYHLLPELGEFCWYDIMRLAAYRQFNPSIPGDALCCKTGRLKSQYGVEPILRLLSGDCQYRETHNAYYDAVDELRIMELLGLKLESYDCACISQT